MIRQVKDFFFKFNLREKKNIFSSLSNLSFQTISQIFYPPLMILVWGTDLFGVWIFLFSIPSMFLLFNIQFNDAAIQSISIYNSRKDYKNANLYFSNSVIFVILNLVVFNSLLLFYFLNFNHDFDVLKNFDNDDVKIIIFLLILSVNLKIIEGIFHTGIYSHGKLNIIFNLATLRDVLSKILIIILGFFYNSLIYASFVILLLSLFSLFIHIYYFRNVNINLKFYLKIFSKNIIKKIFVLSIGHNAERISFLIKQAGLIIIIGKFYDTYIVTYVSTSLTLFYFFPKTLFGRISHVYIFELAKLYAKKNIKFLKSKLNFFLKYNFLFMIIFSFFSLSLGPIIYKIWTNNNFQIIFFLFFLIVIDAFTEVIKISVFTIFKSLNKFVLLGIVDMIITLLAFIIFFISLEFEIFGSLSKSYVFIIFGNILNLVASVIFFYYFYKSKFQKSLIF